MIFYAGNDPEMVWWDNPIGSTGPKPVQTYDEFFDLVSVAEPTIKRRISLRHETNENLEIVVIENIENEHFYVFLIESNTWMMKYIHTAVKNAENNGRNNRAFYRIMEAIRANTGYHTNNNMTSLLRATKGLSEDDIFVETGLAQRLIDACAPTPTEEDPF